MADQITNVANAFETRLTASLSPTDLVINVISTEGTPSLPFYLVLSPDVQGSREVVLVDGSKTPSSFTLSSTAQRGLDGTTAVEHDFEAKAGIYPTAALWKDINDRVDGVRTDLALGSLREVVVFNSSGDFVKANYPWLHTVRVRAVGGGGGGGGAEGGTSTAAAGSGGGAGAYAEKVLHVDELLASEPITIGANASGGAAAGGNGGAGVNTTFGAHLEAGGGGGGVGMAATSDSAITIGGVGNTTGTGADLIIFGGDGGHGVVIGGAVYALGMFGGASHLGGSIAPGFSLHANGRAANSPGGGGSGATASTTSRSGGAGKAGKVVIELYA